METNRTYPPKFEGSELSDEEFIESTETKGPKFWKCVAVARRKDVVAVRNNDDPNKTTIYFTVREWEGFIRGVKKKEFDNIIEVS